MLSDNFLDDRLIDILNTYTGEMRSGDLLKNMFSNAKAPQMTVPVLGMQGMGKSTLINSILGKNILPNNADETTCVPVEICYGEENYAEVFFKNTDKKQIIHSREELNSFVDNNENPANEKKVSRIVLYDELPLLKSGITIVDLPGVGSLTPENAETTNKYIQNLCTAVFVIPTTPTIRKQEYIFIKNVWTQFPTAVFVQNHWDENKRELRESVEYNTIILKKAAKEINTEFDGNIIVVNAYDALVGSLKKDEKAAETSGLSKLLETLNILSEEWEENMNRNLLARLIGELENAKRIIENKLLELEMSKEKVIEKRERELEDFRQKTNDIKKKIKDIRNYLEDKESDIRKKAKKVSQDCASNIRKDVFGLIDKGVTDGDRLNDAFKNYQEEYVTDAFDSMFSDFINIKSEIEEKLYELENLTIDDFDKNKCEEFKKDSQFKFEKSFKVIGGIAGGIGGLAAGGAIGGIAALGAAAVPLGIVAALGIVLIGPLIGSLSKKAVTKKRGSETKEEISPYIDEIQQKIESEIIGKFNDVSNNILTILKNILNDRKDEEEKMSSKLYDTNEISDKLTEQKKLEDDLEFLNKKIAEAKDE